MLAGAAAASFVCWIALPGTSFDRLAFTAVARGFANPPFFLTGDGSQSHPWHLGAFTSKIHTQNRLAPMVVSLGDDPDGVFQSSPPSPIDLAVILTNFQRLGAKKSATATVLAWDNPDPVGLLALDRVLDRFDSLVMAAPLSRGAVSEPMPPAFRRASVPLETIDDKRSQLPMVNHIPLPGVILGKDNAMAGFQSLDSESGTQAVPLLARWEDRVVFAFPLLVVLQRLDLPVTGMEIRLGEYLKLGSNGPIVPIDCYGRLILSLKPVASSAAIPAAALIDGGDDLFPKQWLSPVVLRDDRSAADPSTRAFSKKLPTLIAALASDTGLTPARDYPRLQSAAELLLLALAVLALTAISGLPDFPRVLGFLAILWGGLTAQFLSVGFAGLWLPGLPVLAALTWAWAISCLIALPPVAPPPAMPVPLPPRPVHPSVSAGDGRGHAVDSPIRIHAVDAKRQSDDTLGVIPEGTMPPSPHRN